MTIYQPRSKWIFMNVKLDIKISLGSEFWKETDFEMGESFHCRLLLNERFISPTENLNKDQLGYWEIRQTYIIHVSVQLSLTGREIPLLIFCKHRSKYNHFCCSELAQIVLAHGMGSTHYFALFYSAWDPVHPWEGWCSTVRNVQHFGDIITTLMDTFNTLEEGYEGVDQYMALNYFLYRDSGIGLKNHWDSGFWKQNLSFQGTLGWERDIKFV